MRASNASALTLALALGFLTPAEAEEWTGAHATLGLSAASTNLGEREVTDSLFLAYEETQDRTFAPYVAAGYDWGFQGFTIGIVGDLDFGSIDNGDAVSGGKGFYGESDWFATLRGRVGMQVADEAQVYASGGMAWMRVGATGVPFVGDPLQGDSQTLTGPAFGLGSEFILSPGRHLTIEVLHADFGTSDVFLPDTGSEGTLDPDVTAFRVGYTLRF